MSYTDVASCRYSHLLYATKATNHNLISRGCTTEQFKKEHRGQIYNVRYNDSTCRTFLQEMAAPLNNT